MPRTHPQRGQHREKWNKNLIILQFQQLSHRTRGLGPVQNDVAELPGQLLLTLSSEPTTISAPPPAWCNSDLPPAQSSTGTAQGQHQVACTGQKEQDHTPGVFSSLQEAFEGVKGMLLFQTLGLEHLSWRQIVLPPSGQAWGFVQGRTLCRDVAQETKQLSVETQSTKGPVLAPAQDTPRAPQVGVCHQKRQGTRFCPRSHHTSAGCC